MGRGWEGEGDALEKQALWRVNGRLWVGRDVGLVDELARCLVVAPFLAIVVYVDVEPSSTTIIRPTIPIPK